MRRIGTLSDRQEAERFGDFLLTLQIKSQIDSSGNEWAIWVHDEDRLEDAKRELEAYRAEPEAERYQQAIVEADRLRHAEVRKRQEAKKNTVDMAQRWRRPMIVQIPLTFALVVISVVVSVGTRLGENMNSFGGKLSLVEVRSAGEDHWRPVDPQTGGDRYVRGLWEVRHGQVWRLVTPIFLHLGRLHLLMNMYWTVVFGSLIETRQRWGTLLLVVLVTAVFSNLSQYYFKQSPAFGGMSGVIFGLFGYLWMLGRMNPRSDVHVPPNLVFFFIAWLFLCMTGAVGPIANYAHAFGLLTGMALGAARGWWANVSRSR